MNEEAKREWARARAAFDTITQAAYFGFSMRELIATDPEVLEAAEKLAALLHAKMKGAYT